MLDEVESGIKRKIESIGLPLKNWDVHINYGIKTGFNDAFIITGQQRTELLKKCPKSDEIIRPIFKGRHIRKYSADEADFIILIPCGWTNANRNNCEAETCFKETYPAIYDHFIEKSKIATKGNGLFNRTDQGDYWWELRPCAYLHEFEKSKIVWMELSDIPKFLYDDDKKYAETTTFIMTGNHLKYLTAFLNSKLCEWYFDKITTTSGVGTNRWKKIYIENFPIPEISEQAEKNVNRIIDNILVDLKSKKNINNLDLKINELVLDLYDFNNEEKELILTFGNQ